MANQKQILERLEQIKQQAAGMAAKASDKAAANLAEEAVGLALELHDLQQKKGA